MAGETVMGLLLKHQLDHDMSEHEMAAFLKVPFITWRKTKAGKIPIGRRILRAAMDEHLITAFQAGKQLLVKDNGSAAPDDLPLRDSDTMTEEMGQKVHSGAGY